MARKPQFGYVQLQKTGGVAAGSTYLASAATVGMEILGVAPYNPLNRVRPRLMNASAFLSVIVQGKKLPGLTMACLMKPSWHTKLLVNSCVLSWDANNNSDELCVNISDGSAARQFQQGRCSRIAIVGAGQQGQVLVNMDFVCRQAESDVSSPTTFGSFTTDAGNATDVTGISFNATATGTRAYSLVLLREQIPDFWADGTLFSNRVESGSFGGSVTLQMDPDAGTIPTTAVTLQFGLGGAGVQYACALDKDAETYPLDPSILGTITREYTFINSSGTQPVTVTSF